MLLHGLYGNAREWLPIARALEDDFHLVAPDLRNHGASPHAPRQSVCLMAEDVLCALEGLTITPYAVMGHSMGGLVAQQMAVTAPERVRCVVLLDSHLLGMSLPPDLATNHCAWQLALERACAHQGLEREAMRALLLASMPAAVAERLLANYVRRDGAWRWRLGVEGIHHYVCGQAPDNSTPQPMHQPLLLVRAAQSGYTASIRGHHLAHFAPTHSVLELPGDDHYPHYAHRVRVLTAVRQFLRTHLTPR